MFGFLAVIEKRPRRDSFLLPITARIADVAVHIKPQVTFLTHCFQVAFLAAFRFALAQVGNGQNHPAIGNRMAACVHRLAAI